MADVVALVVLNPVGAPGPDFDTGEYMYIITYLHA